MSNFELFSNLNNELPISYHHTVVTPKYNCPNWHNHIEILYISDGVGRVLCGAHNYEASKGDIFFFNTNDIHSVKSETSMKINYFKIENYFCISNGIPVEDMEFTTKIQSEELYALCEKLAFEFDNSLPFQVAGIRTSLLDLMLNLARNYSQPRTIIDRYINSPNENIKLAMGYMESHFDQNISLDEIAYEAGISKFYFSRAFKNITGMTVVTYLNTLRCNEAKKLLKKNKYTIHEIAKKCGFLNDSYFSRTFKKYTGMLPTEYISKAK